MKTSRPQSAVDYKLSARFDQLRERLLASRNSQKLEKPLAFYTVASDRRLPLAFLGHTVRDVIDTPFVELLDTAGVGQKKIASLLNLLNRIASSTVPEPVASAHTAKDAGEKLSTVLPGDPGFDASAVPEASWELWRAAVVRHGLGQETLGRCVKSLQELPRVVWTTPLETYTGLTLDEIRSLKTHGEKRVRVIIEVFGTIHRLVGNAAPPAYLGVSARPKFVRPIENWICDVLQRETAPDMRQVRRHFIEPLLAQVRVDAGDSILRLAEGRLGLSSAGGSVRKAAKRMGLTRARVYQLLNEVSAIMQVRWPEGESLVAELHARLHQLKRDSRDLETFDAAVELFFPSRHRLTELLGAAGASGSNGRYGALGVGHQRAG